MLLPCLVSSSRNIKCVSVADLQTSELNRLYTLIRDVISPRRGVSAACNFTSERQSVITNASANSKRYSECGSRHFHLMLYAFGQKLWHLHYDMVCWHFAGSFYEKPPVCVWKNVFEIRAEIEAESRRGCVLLSRLWQRVIFSSSMLLPWVFGHLLDAEVYLVNAEREIRIQPSVAVINNSSLLSYTLPSSSDSICRMLLYLQGCCS